MAQPTPQTLRVFEMLDNHDFEQAILQYVNNNRVNININYVHPDRDTMLFQSSVHEYNKLMKKLLDLGATVSEAMMESMIGNNMFEPPVAQAKELMNSLLTAGFLKEKMLHLLCTVISGTHKELLKTLLEQPLDINYKYNGRPALHGLISEYENDFRGIFIEMLRMLMKKGANPNEVDDQGRTAIQMVNSYLADYNPGPILRILQTSPAAAVAPAAPAATKGVPKAAPATNYKKLWADELKKPSPDVTKLEEYKNAGNIDVNADIDSIYNPIGLHLSKKPDLKVIEALLKWGANPNITNYNYPIFWNAFDRSTKYMKKLLELLIKYGADVKLVANNKTSLISFFEHYLDNADHHGFSKKHKEIADMLINNGVDINYKNREGIDVLDMAIDEYDEEAVTYFINKGMSIVVNGRTRLYFSILGNTNNEYGGMMHSNIILNGLAFMLKYYKNINDYFRDYLDAANANPALDTLPHIYPELEKLNPNYNEVYADGSTPLIKAVQLYNKSPQKWTIALVERIVEKGANPNYTDKTGKKAADYTNDDDIKELLGSGGFKILWTGFSRADIDFTNMIFHQTTHASNLAINNPDESLFSICPVCLKYIQHETRTCMYMTHSCVDQAGYNGYYHKKLWNAFSYEKEYDALGRIIPAGQRKRVLEWCTNCGRICKGHRHYAKSEIYKQGTKDIIIPELLGAGDYFATTCDKPGIGGGGIKEKLNRYRRFREMVHYLNDPDFINKIPFEDAINKLVEAVWEAPLDPRREMIQRIQTTGKFNRLVANETFPLPSELPKPPKYLYATPSYPDATNPDLLPLVYPTATGTMKNSQEHLSGDEENIVQFRHKMANGKINNHDQPNQQIALDRLMDYLTSMASTQESGDYGMCWQHQKHNVEIVYDETKPPQKCTAKLYPEEVLHAINAATYTDEAKKALHMQQYEAYRVGFANKFGTKAIGFAPNNSNNNKPNAAANASNSKNNNQYGGKRWATRKRRQHRKQSKSKSYRKRSYERR